MDSNYTALAAAEPPPPAGPAPAGETGPQDGDLKDVDPKKDLPTPLQLWRFIFGDLLFQNPYT